MDTQIFVYMVPLSTFGGSIRRIRLWLRSLKDVAPVVIVFTPAQGTTMSHLLGFEEHDRVEVKEIVSKERGKRWIAPAKSGAYLLWRVLRAKRSAVVSTLAYSDFIAHVVTKAAKLVKGKNVAHVVYLDTTILLHQFRWLLERVCRSADGVIVLSERLAKEQEVLFGVPKEKIKVVPISVKCPEELPVREPRDDGVFVFGVLQRLHPFKSIDYIIRACSRCVRRGIPIQLKIYGDGPDRERLKRLTSELGLEKNVIKFKGWAEDPFAVLRSVDCLVLSSTREGTPRSILEAGSFGVPVIAPKVGGVPDLIEHGKDGRLYSHWDIDELENLMAKVATEPELAREAGRRMWKRIKRERSPEREAEAFVAAVQDLTGFR